VSFRRDGEIRHNPNRVLGPLSNDLIPDRGLRRHEYGVRSRMIGCGSDASFGTRMEVNSFTPSRMGIITSCFVYVSAYYKVWFCSFYCFS
jgi:hypothetical protein